MRKNSHRARETTLPTIGNTMLPFQYNIIIKYLLSCNIIIILALGLHRRLTHYDWRRRRRCVVCECCCRRETRARSMTVCRRLSNVGDCRMSATGTWSLGGGGGGDGRERGRRPCVEHGSAAAVVLGLRRPRCSYSSPVTPPPPHIPPFRRCTGREYYYYNMYRRWPLITNPHLHSS